MTYQLRAETAASVSELKANPMRVVVLNRNEPAFYCVPAWFTKSNRARRAIDRPAAGRNDHPDAGRI